MGLASLQNDLILQHSMRFHKPVKPFQFQDDGKPLRQALDPVKVSHYPDLVERIHAKYPFIDQTQIATIVLATFEIMRELLLRGCILTIKKLVTDCKLHFFQHIEGGVAYSAVKIKTGTTTKWKTKENFNE